MFAIARTCAKQGPFASDAGITDLMTTLKYHDGKAVWDSVDNPRWLKTQLNKVVDLQRVVSALEQRRRRSRASRPGSRSMQLKAAYGRVRGVHKRVRDQRHDFFHKLTAHLVSRFGNIITEQLNVSGMLTQKDKAPASSAASLTLPGRRAC